MNWLIILELSGLKTLGLSYLSLGWSIFYPWFLTFFEFGWGWWCDLEQKKELANHQAKCLFHISYSHNTSISYLKV